MSNCPIRDTARVTARSTARALLGAIPALLLQSAGVASASDVSDVVTVTAPRTSKDLADVPAAVSVVDEDAIQLGRPQVSLDESLRRVPGVFLQNGSNFAQDLRIAIRGFGARSSFGVRGIRLVVDGIPATLPDGQTQLDSIDLGSTRRIEVLRGPASSLYGASAGGVILIESERGTTDPSGETRVAFGNDGYRRYQAKAGGSAGPVDYFASISRLELDGYRDHARTENLMLNGNFRVRIDDSSDLGVSLNVVHAPIADDPGGLTAAEVEDDRRRAAPRNRLYDVGESVDQQQLGLAYRKSFGDHHAVEASSYTGWRQFDNRLPFTDGGRVDLDRFFVGGGLRYVYADRLFGRDNRLLLGFDADAQHDVRKRFDNDLGRRGGLRFDQDENVTGFGVYLQDELRLFDSFELTAGVRYDRVAFDVDDGFPGDGNDGGELDFDEVSPRVGLVFRPHPAFHVFANVGTSFETPTTTELADPSGAGGFNGDLDAQTALSGELGVKGVIAGRLRYEAVGFVIDVDDELVPFEVASMPGRTFFENAGSSRRSGFELAVTAQPCAGLSASLAYTFSHFQFDRFRTAAGDFDGNDLPGIPRNQLWGEIAYEHPLGFYGSWEVFYADGVYADNANAVKSDSHVVANLRAGWRGELDGWEIGPFIGLNNLFGEKYSDNVRLNAAFGRSFEPAPELEVYGGLSVGYRFGGP